MAGDALNVFISYSHRDEDLKDELAIHLKLLQRDGKINTWQDRDIEAGAEWAAEIKANLESAQIILLLITKNFLASDYCYEKEMQRAVQRHYEGTARVIPIILKPCGWKYSDFKSLQVLPKDGKPVSRWEDPDEAFLDVENGLRRVIESLQSAQALLEVQPGSSSSPLSSEGHPSQSGMPKSPSSVATVQPTKSIFVEPTPELSAPPAHPYTAKPQTLESSFTERIGNVELEMIKIPAGKFWMGSPDTEAERFDDEGPQHLVTVPEFWMGKYSVTQAQWTEVAALPKVELDLQPFPSRFKGAKRPVEQVNWHEAVEFCDRLSHATGRTYRLPSEAEWEYACRAGTNTRYSFGESLSNSQANFGNRMRVVKEGFLGVGREEEQVGTEPVGSYPANKFGLNDMHGNVREWCADHWHSNYEGAPTDGSAWLSDNQSASRLLRGGSWVAYPRHCRSAARSLDSPDNRDNGFGFRVVCVAA